MVPQLRPRKGQCGFSSGMALLIPIQRTPKGLGHLREFIGVVHAFLHCGDFLLELAASTLLHSDLGLGQVHAISLFGLGVIALGLPDALAGRQRGWSSCQVESSRILSSRVESSPVTSSPVKSDAVTCRRIRLGLHPSLAEMDGGWSSCVVSSCQVLSGRIRSCLVWSGRVMSSLVSSSRILSCQGLASPTPLRSGEEDCCLVRSGRVASRPVVCRQVRSGRVLSCPI
jgi:hypothetical protein